MTTEEDQIYQELIALTDERERADLSEAVRRVQQREAQQAAEAQQRAEAERQQQEAIERYRAEVAAIEAQRERNRVNGQLADSFWSNWRSAGDDEVALAQMLGRFLYRGIEPASTGQRNLLARFIRIPDLGLFSNPLYGEA